ncbi:hypothetical protein J6590_046975, partial [Homalodisca vitripennis]
TSYETYSSRGSISQEFTEPFKTETVRYPVEVFLRHANVWVGLILLLVSDKTTLYIFLHILYGDR